MASCTYCSSFILFGGEHDETGRYCNEECQTAGQLLALSYQLPMEDLHNFIQQTHKGHCPKCQKHGIIDIHNAYRVWSIFLMSSWSTHPDLTCKACAVKRQLGSIVFCGTLGWWGIPWGLIMTPVQIIRNFIGIYGGPSPHTPGLMLEKHLRIEAAAQAVEHAQHQQHARQYAHHHHQGPPPLP